MTDPKKPEAAPAAKPTFPKLVEALQQPDLEFSTPGAALYVAHALVELGANKVAAMGPKEICAHAAEFLRKVPMAWPAFRMGNPVQLTRTCDLYGIEHEKVEFYQSEIARLTPSALPPELLEFNKAQAERLVREGAAREAKSA